MLRDGPVIDDNNITLIAEHDAVLCVWEGSIYFGFQLLQNT